MCYREKSEAEIYCEIKEAFQIFDKDNDGRITKEEEQTILRMFGINPNEKEEKKENKKEDKKQKEGDQENQDEDNGEEGEDGKTSGHIEEEKKDPQKEKVEFNEFFDNIQKKLKDAIKDSEILEEIDSGYLIAKRELEHDLQNSKEHIDNDLIKKIIEDSVPNGGDHVVYEDFVKLMLNKS